MADDVLSIGFPMVKERKSKRLGKSVIRLIGASVALIGVVLSWVLMAELLQELNKDYRKPFFLSWLVRSFYAIMYVVWMMWRVFPGNFSCNRVGDGAFQNARPLLITSAVLSIIGLFGGYTWFISLPRTNIPANNAIYQATPAFVFIFSVPLLREKITAVKVSSVVLCVIGVALVAFYSFEDPCGNNSGNSNGTDSTTNKLSHINPHHSNCTEKSTPVGYVYLLVGVISYALYQVLYKKYTTKEGDPAAITNGMRVVGYIGAFTLFFLWFPIIILHYADCGEICETFELPSQDMIGMVFLNILLETIFQVAMAICITLSSPLFGTVGSVLVVPVSVVLDWIMQGYELPYQAYFGVTLILVGFAGFILSEIVAVRRKEKEERVSKKKSIQYTSSQVSDMEDHPLLGESAESGNTTTRSWASLVLYYLV